MIFRQIVHEDLGCASYFIGDDKAGVAAVVDPRFEIEAYLELAEFLGVQIEHVFETHNHADHISGHGRLVAAAGATIHIHRLVAPDFPHEPFEHGDAFMVGALRIEALHTPGHRPEHTCFLLTDTHRSQEPWAALTGDSLFVGDVARPDLAVEGADGAREMFHSLRTQLLGLPDYIEVWPGHLGGSMCGGPGMDMKGSSTIGFERHHNGMLRITDEQEFVTASVAKLGAQPPNFKAIVELNHGPLLTEPVTVVPLAATGVERRIAGGALVIDTRDDTAHANGHLPGSLWIPLGRGGFGTRLAWLAAGRHELIFNCEHDHEAARAGALAAAVGLAEAVAQGGFLAGGVSAWVASGRTLERLERLPVGLLEASRASGKIRQILDVRDHSEFELGHIPGSLNVTWHDITGIPDGFDATAPIATICASSLRAGVAASLLQRYGASQVIHVIDGGVLKWASLGGSLSTGPES